MIQNLDSTDRRRLLAFICSFAWADAEVQQDERNYISRLVTALGEEVHLEVGALLELLPARRQTDERRFDVQARGHGATLAGGHGRIIRW